MYNKLFNIFVKKLFINDIDLKYCLCEVNYYIAPIERSAKLRESSERRDYGHEKTMDRQGKARDSA